MNGESGAVVWKHLLKPGENLVELRGRARPIGVAHTSSGACLWVLEERGELAETTLWLVVGTGEPIGYPVESLRPAGTFVVLASELVYHVFEVVSRG